MAESHLSTYQRFLVYQYFVDIGDALRFARDKRYTLEFEKSSNSQSLAKELKDDLLAVNKVLVGTVVEYVDYL